MLQEENNEKDLQSLRIALYIYSRADENTIKRAKKDYLQRLETGKANLDQIAKQIN